MGRINEVPVASKTFHRACLGRTPILKSWQSLGLSNLGQAYRLQHVQLMYQLFGEEIPKFGECLGVSNLDQGYMLKHLQATYQVFGEEIPKFGQSWGFPI